ncbi:permease [Brassicibacter mesophilus]|uniref:permease n=1 Tax=Brassicibacter mesophilus TaxID=745119 RepID=UPI003D1D3A76
MSIAKCMRRNKLLLIVGAIYLSLVVFKTDKAVQAFENSSYYIIEMLQIMPVIFILTSLIEAWIPREVIMNSFGESSGKKGAIISFLLGSVSAGPIYAAFPVCKMLLKKGAKISNIVIILSTWAVIKVPMLANEAKFLGLKFMAVRWILTTISIFIMAYLVSKIVQKDTIPVEDKKGNNDGIKKIGISKQYCIGCGLCEKLSPEMFKLIDGKAALIKEHTNTDVSDIEIIINKCPAKAIGYE